MANDQFYPEQSGDDTYASYAVTGTSYPTPNFTRTTATYVSSLRCALDGIPNGATITSATLYGCLYYDWGNDYDITVYVEDTDNAAVFTSSENPYSERTMWGTTLTRTFSAGAAGSWRSIDVTSLIQHIVDRSGYSAGNHVALSLDDDGATKDDSDLMFYAYDYGSNLWYLDITWENPPASEAFVDRSIPRGVCRGIMRGVT